MAKLIWDAAGQKVYETGVSHGVLYPISKTTPGTYDKGVAWNGLITITESPTGAEPTAIYADNIKYLNLMSVEEFGATVEAYTYPDEFAICDGSAALAEGVIIGQQKREIFALCYQTVIGNDMNPEAGFKLHIIYGAQASPSERAYSTINDSPEAIAFSWEIITTPIEVTGFKPTALLTIDSTKVDAAKLQTVLDSLYGTADDEPTLLLPDEIAAIFVDTPAG